LLIAYSTLFSVTAERKGKEGDFGTQLTHIRQDNVKVKEQLKAMTATLEAKNKEVR